jgi:hypothetical protein
MFIWLLGRKGMPIKIRNGLFLCFLMGLFFPLHSWAQEKPIGKIIGLRGFVEILVSEPVAQVEKGDVKKVSAEVWQQIKKNQPVYIKDTYRTGRKSRIKILFEDKSLMALGPRTRMSVESYLYKPEDKLRQGVINVAHGLSMYIVNKSQKNKKSSFRIVSPTGNLAARGTQGYVSASKDKMLIANQAGTVLISNSDPNVGLERKSNWSGFEPVFSTVAYSEEVDFFAQLPGGNEVPLGAMMQGTIPLGGFPTAAPMTPGTLLAVQNLVLAPIGPSSALKSLIKVQTGGPAGEGDGEGGEEGGGDGGSDGGSEGGDSEFTSSFEEGGQGGGEEGGNEGGGGGDIFTETAAEPTEETDGGCTS